MNIYPLFTLRVSCLAAVCAAFLSLSPVKLRAQTDPALVGQWSGIVNLPLVPIHVTLLPNGNIVMWNHGHGDLADSAGKRYVKDSPTPYLWNLNAPMSATNPVLLSVPDVFSNGQHSDEIYCSGHSLLPDGRLLVVGGHLSKFNSDSSNRANLEETGSPQLHLFDFASNGWSLNQAPMNDGRWYPTTMPLGNGNTLIVGGIITRPVDGSGQPLADQYIYNQMPQIYQPANGSVASLSNAGAQSFTYPTYPWMYSVPGTTPGTKAFYAGPGPDTRFLDLTGQGSWGAPIPNTFGVSRCPGPVHQGSSVLYDQGKVLNMGGVNMTGGSTISFSASAPVTNTAETVDLNVSTPSWRAVPSMRYARQHHNATLLPDGNVLVTGGSSAPGFSNVSGAVLAAEQWNPATQAWSVMASMSVPRLHHGMALLLPDGRVMVGGGGQTGLTGEIDHPDVQFYSPPYLFKGARPVITSVDAATLTYGQPFSIQTPDNRNITSVLLMRLGSVSHGFNFNQAVSQLKFKKNNRGNANALDVTMVTDRNVIPPGHYMLFLVNNSGVPSTARILQVK